MEQINLLFRGPYSFLPKNTNKGNRSWIFEDSPKNPPKDSPKKTNGVYIWTIKSKSPDSGKVENYINYIGECDRTFSERHDDHFSGILSMHYSIYDPTEVMNGITKPFWQRDLTGKNRGTYNMYIKQLEQYQSPGMSEKVIKYLDIIDIFIATPDKPSNLKHVEGKIGYTLLGSKKLKGKDEDTKKFYPKGFHIDGDGTELQQELIVFVQDDIKIKGLDSKYPPCNPEGQ